MLSSAAAGEPGVVLNVGLAELLDESIPAAGVISGVLDRAAGRIIGQWRVNAVFRESGLADQLLNSLRGPTPAIRASGARLCGALRLPESVPWLADLIDDPNAAVRDTAVRALGKLGGWEAVQALTAAGDKISIATLAITLSSGASDLDIESLIRQSATERTAVATVLACGLRRDPLRLPTLVGIANDRRWPMRVRTAACISLGAIGDASTLDSLGRLADNDPVPGVRSAAERARRRVLRARDRRR